MDFGIGPPPALEGEDAHGDLNGRQISVFGGNMAGVVGSM